MFLNAIPKVYVINMNRDKNRLAFINKQFRRYNYIPERISAIATKDGEYKKYEKNFKQYIGGNDPNAISCALSHLKVYKKIMSDNVPFGLVIEDDITVTGYITKLPDIIKSLPKDWDVVWIGNSRSKWPRNTCSSIPDPEYDMDKVDEITPNLYRFTSEECKKTGNCPMGTYAYLIHRRVISKILNDYKVDVPIDTYLQMNESLNKYFTIPSLITHCFNFGTNTDGHNNTIETYSSSEKYTKLKLLLPIIISLQILLFFFIFFTKKTVRTILIITCNLIILVSIIFYHLFRKKISNDPFQHIWANNRDSYKQVEKMMNKVFDIFNKYKVKYSFAYGTLLGYARHNDLIPWDDDIDIIIDEDDLEIFKEKCIPELKKYNIDSVVFQNIPGIKYKLCDLRNKKIKGYNYSWPFIDIFVYKKVNEYTIFDYNESQKISFPNKFKLKKVTMNNINGYVPENYELYLNKMFPNWSTECISTGWNHRLEIGQIPVSTKCKYFT